MHFVTIRELRIRPGEVWKRLEAEQDLVLTSNGKPIALLTDIDEDRLEETLTALRQARAQAAIARIHRIAVEKGLDKISDEEIHEEITAYRVSRRSRRPRR